MTIKAIEQLKVGTPLIYREGAAKMQVFLATTKRNSFRKIQVSPSPNYEANNRMWVKPRQLDIA